MTLEGSGQASHALESSLANSYLSAKGWQAVQEGKTTRWSHPDSSEQITFEADSAPAPELAQQLARLEHRPEACILTELRYADADVLRVMPAGAAANTLLLDQGTRLLRGIHRLLTAASRAVMEPGSMLVGKKPREVAEYLRTLQMGIPEPEAYTVTVLSPLKDTDQESLARQSLLRLATTLHALESLTERGVADPETRRRLISGGLSAELCDALVLMIGKAPQKVSGRSSAKQSLTVEFAWSPRLAPPVGTPMRMTFESAQAEDLKELAESLRETVPQENFHMQGTVSDLKRAHHEGTGKVVVRNITREVPDKVTLELEDALYTLAVQAHQMKTPVLCAGVLVKKGKSFELIQASLAPVESLSAAD